MDKTVKVVEKGHDILQTFINYQNKADGIDRPDLFTVDKSKTLDDIAMETSEVATYLSSLIKLIPMQSELSRIGRKLESEGKIKCDIGDSYAELALKYFKENN